MSRTFGSEHPPLGTLGRVGVLGPNHPPGQNTPNKVGEHVADPSWLDDTTWSAMAGGAPGRQRLRQQPAMLDPAIRARHAAAFARQSASLRAYLASQELSQAIRVERDGLTLRLGAVTTILPPPKTGTDLSQQVAATKTALQNEGQRLKDEIVAQAFNVELLFAIAIGTAVAPNDAAAAPSTLELIDAVSWTAAWPIYLSKHLLNVPRPEEIDPSLGTTIVPTPPHASYPSGHATVSHALAEVLAAVMGAGPGSGVHSVLHDFAARIARNREVAGLHTAADSSAGRVLGTALGRWMVQSASTDQADRPLWALLFADASQEWVDLGAAPAPARSGA